MNACLQIFFATCLTLVFGSVMLSSKPAWGQLPASPEKLSVPVSVNSAITFFRLPREKDILPIVNGKAAKDPVGTSAHYLAETELSLGTVKSLLDAKRWVEYQNRVLSLMGKDDDPKWGDYRNAVRQGSEEYPAVLLGIREIIEMCQSLEVRASQDSHRAGIEITRFRIPSRVEWQFAARATTNVEDRNKYLYFPKWARYADIPGIEGRISDLQQKLGDSPNPSAVAEQGAFLDLIDRAQLRDDTRTEASEILGAILSNALGFEPNIGTVEESGLRPIREAKPNAWGFHRMFGNVPEWTLATFEPNAITRLWEGLNEENALSLHANEDFGTLMGGSFVSLVPRPYKWAEYAIEGGYPLKKGTREPTSYRVAECISEKDSGIEDGMGGLRLLAERTLARNWFVALRAATILNRPSSDIAIDVSKITSTLEEISPSSELASNLELAGLYLQFKTHGVNVSEDDWRGMLEHITQIKFASSSPKEDEKVNEIKSLFSGFSLSSDKNNAAPEKNQKEKPKSKPAKPDFFAVSLELANHVK